MLCPLFPPSCEDRRRRALKSHPLVKEALGLPVHLLIGDGSPRTGAINVRPHVLAGDLPFGSIASTPLGIDVVSPLVALFQLGRRIPETHLIMAMYEFCGWFTVFKPSPAIEALLEDYSLELNASSFGWRRILSAEGKATDLWQRPPLIEIDELSAFAEIMRSRRGGAIFYEAAQRVTGVAASPFEVQASMLLGLPRKKGGEGFEGLKNNQRISFSKDALVISGRRSCFADILLESRETDASLVVECQGRMVHGSGTAVMSDSDRATALQHMGYDVLLLTYSQIAKSDNFDVIRKMIASKLGLKYQSKGKLLLERERELRRDLFVDWNMLGSWHK